jgi:type II secretory pathway component PulF
MENIFSGVSVTDMGTQATGFISAFSPFVAYILGILFAFLIISFIVSMVSKKKHNFWDQEEDDDIDEDY